MVDVSGFWMSYDFKELSNPAFKYLTSPAEFTERERNNSSAEYTLTCIKNQFLSVILILMWLIILWVGIDNISFLSTFI